VLGAGAAILGTSATIAFRCNDTDSVRYSDSIFRYSTLSGVALSEVALSREKKDNFRESGESAETLENPGKSRRFGNSEQVTGSF